MAGAQTRFHKPMQCAGGPRDLSYEVASIVDAKDEGTATLYRIRWKGYPASYDTWEPPKNLGGCENALRDWLKKMEAPSAASGKRKLAASVLRPKRLRTSSSPQSSTSPNISTKDCFNLSELYHSPSDCPSVTYDNGKTAWQPKPKPAKDVFKHEVRPADRRVLEHPDYNLFQSKLNALVGPSVALVNEEDLEPSPPTDFEFLMELRLSDGVPGFDDEFLHGCSCRDGCHDASQCACIEDSHDDPAKRKFAYNRHGRVTRNNWTPIIECNKRCRCGPACLNRVVQNGRKVRLEIFKTKNKGWGLRSPDFLKKGAFVDKYLGEVIDNKEATRRSLEGHQQGLSYLFDLDKYHVLHEESEDELSRGHENLHTRVHGEMEKYTIDGRMHGGVTRFINHSCDPNLHTFAVVSNRKDQLIYDLALFAKRDIHPYEELTFAYVSPDDSNFSLSQDPATDKWPCFCGAKNCAKWLWS